MPPGVLLLWSVDRPRSIAIPIPTAGLTLGRELLEPLIGTVTDERLSRQHVKLTIGSDGTVRADDAGSRNGTYVNGRTTVGVANRFSPPAVIRTGRTVWMVVPDLRRYEKATLSRRGRLVVGGTLATTCRAVDLAAREESHLVLLGPLTIGRELARSYATSIGGSAVRFDPETVRLPLERVLENAQARTLVLELTSALRPRDVATLATWLETDLRVVTCVKDERFLPVDLIDKLSARRIPLPKDRYDEIPTSVVDLIRELAPEAEIHATVIERCLIELRSIDEDVLMTQLRETLLRWHAATPDTKLRGADLDIEDPDLLNHCVIAEPGRPPRRIMRLQEAEPPAFPPVLPRPAPADASWDQRRLCVDGACFGVVGPDGRCAVCERAIPLPDPYR